MGNAGLSISQAYAIIWTKSHDIILGLLCFYFDCSFLKSAFCETHNFLKLHN